jgi:hypothetical protein
MMQQTSEIHEAHRCLQLAAAAEQVALTYRTRAQTIMLSCLTSNHVARVEALEPEPDEESSAPPPAVTDLPGGAATITSTVISLCTAKHGATREELMVAAGWPRIPYPSTLKAMADRRGLRMEDLVVDGVKRVRFVKP